MVRECRAWVICCITGWEDISEHFIVIFSQGSIAPESCDFMTTSVFSARKHLVERGAGHGVRIGVQSYRFGPQVVVDELYMISILSKGQCRERTAYIQMYMFTVHRSALHWHFDQPWYVLGLDADCAQRIIICISLS